MTVFGVLLVTASRNERTYPDRTKARYYYMEGVRLQSEGDDAGSYEYFKKANMIDPGYEEAASAFGTSRLLNSMDSVQSEAELLRSLDLMRQFVDRYPDDFYEAQYYAYVASKLNLPEEAIRVFERTDSMNPEKTMTLIHLSEIYAGIGETGKALDALQRYEKVEGNSPQLTLRKASLRLFEKDTVGALREADDLIASNSKEPTFRLLKGNLYEAINLPDSAETCYKEAENLAPDNGAVKISLANIYKQRGDSAAYDAKIYEALLSEDFDLSQKNQLLAEYLQTLFSNKSDTSRGDYLFSVLRDEYPHEPTVLDLDARYSAAKRDMADAIEKISYAIDLSPENENYWSQLITYQAADHRYEDALQTYEKSLAHIEPSENLKLLYANAASLGGEEGKAEKMYSDMILEIVPEADINTRITDTSLRQHLGYDDLLKASALFTMLGDSYYQADDIEKAFNAYENALYFYYDNALTLNNYAYFSALHGADLDKAEQMSRNAVSQQPENETYLDTYAWIMFKKGNYKEAREYQEKAMNIAEEKGDVQAELYEHYGDILFMDGAPAEALDNWTKALNLDPENELLRKKVEHKTFFYE